MREWLVHSLETQLDKLEDYKIQAFDALIGPWAGERAQCRAVQVGLPVFEWNTRAGRHARLQLAPLTYEKGVETAGAVLLTLTPSWLPSHLCMSPSQPQPPFTPALCLFQTPALLHVFFCPHHLSPPIRLRTLLICMLLSTSPVETKLSAARGLCLLFSRTRPRHLEEHLAHSGDSVSICGMNTPAN